MRSSSRFIGLAHDYQPADNTATAPYVLDTTTGLVWARTLIQRVSPKRLDHADASEAVKALGEGWRLPTVEELFALADRSRQPPAIDTEAFPDTPSDWFWTSTPAVWNPSASAWIVNFHHGAAYAGNRGGDAFVRAVRSASPELLAKIMDSGDA